MIYVHNVIPEQKQVRDDVYSILKRLGYDAQSPDCVAITTYRDMNDVVRHMFRYPFNKEYVAGCYKDAVNIDIPIKYEFRYLVYLVLRQIRLKGDK